MKFLPPTGGGASSQYTDPNAPIVFTQLSGGGRMVADKINQLSNNPRDLTATVAARGSLVPVLYGRRDVPGMVFAVGQIGTDLVMGYIWCIGEVDAVETVYLNDEAVPAGVSLTHYKGTPTQGVDGTLASAVAGYADTLRYDIPGGGKLGVCYSVVRIPVGKLGGFPRARAVIRGRKVLDPRTSVAAYTANPALHLSDLIANPVFGLGRTVIGVTECANWCDSLLGGLPGVFRARAALYLASGRPAEQYIDLLCEYAECLKVNEGSTIKIIPDAPVDLSSTPIIGPADILEDSFSLSADSSIDTPSEVELQYTQEPTVGSQSWALAPVVQRLPGVSEGVVQRIPTSITLDGIYRAEEASNKALARLNRMQNRMNANWQTLDIGVMHQRGDVKRIQLPARGIDIVVRIESVALAAYGRYNVTASRYDLDHYPSESPVLPDADGVIPVGAIAILIGSEVPEGWALFAEANGRFIAGAGGSLASGATGGASNMPAISFTTSVDGDHSPSQNMRSPRNGSASGMFSVPWEKPFARTDGAHSHTVTMPGIVANPLHQQVVLVIKTGADADKLPPTVRVLGLHNTNTQATKDTSLAGRLIKAGATNAVGGAASISFSNKTAAGGGHTHNGAYQYDFDPATFGGTTASLTRPSGEHNHTASCSRVYSPKTQQVCTFWSSTPYVVKPGMIFLWSGEALPANFVVCDGTGGTPDMRDRLASFAGAVPTPPSGDDTIKATITFDSQSHNHDYGQATYIQGGVVRNIPGHQSTGHANDISHTHSEKVITQSFTPLFYALTFIMYAPS